MCKSFMYRKISRNRNSPIMYTAFMRIYITQCLNAILLSAGGLIDGIIVGSFLGSDLFVAYGIAVPVLSLITTVAVIFSAGTGILCGNAMGKGKKDEVNGILATSIVIALVTGATIMLVLSLASNPIAMYLGATDENCADVRNYILGLIPGIFFIMLNGIVCACLQFNGRLKRVVGMVIASTASHIVMDLFVCKTLGGNVFGIALATSLGYMISVVVGGLPILAKKNVGARIDFSKLLLKKSGNIILSGLPTAVAFGALAVKAILLNRLVMNVAGTIGVFALSIQCNIGGFIEFSTAAICSATMTVMSVVFGKRNSEEICVMMKRVLMFSFIMGVFTFSIKFFFAGPIVSLYSPENEEYYRMAVKYMMFWAFESFVTVVDGALMSFYLASGRKLISNITSLLQGCVLTVVLAYFLSPIMGIDGVWLSTPLTAALTTVTIIIYIVICNKGFPSSFKKFLLIPKGYGANTKNCLYKNIYSTKDCVDISQKIYKFCNNHEMDKKTSYHAALSMEEATQNIIERGFKNKSRDKIEVYVVCVGEKLVINLVDNCKPFNLEEQAKNLDFDKFPIDIKNIGLKIISILASKMTYQSHFGFNCLTIEIEGNKSEAKYRVPSFSGIQSE